MSVAVLGAIAASGSGGPAPYVAPAVHFDSSTNIQNAALTAANSGKWSASLWVKFDAQADGSFYGMIGNDPATGQSQTYGFTDGVNLPAATGINPIIGDGTSFAGLNNATIPVAFATWVHLLISFDASVNPALGNIYINDVADGGFSAVGAPFVATWSGLPALIGADSTGDNMLGDMADVWVAPGVSLLDGAGLIPEATRRLFISATGKPVDPSGFPASAMLFSGNAASFGTNQGTGGAFTTTGTLTNSSSSPSD